MQLKEARLRAGINQTELADKIGVKQPVISNIEAGEIYPSRVQQIQINTIVKCNLEWHKHPNAPLTVYEEQLFQKLYKIGCKALGGEEACAEYLSKQSPNSLRKLMVLTGVYEKEVQPLSCNGYPQMKRTK